VAYAIDVATGGTPAAVAIASQLDGFDETERIRLAHCRHRPRQPLSTDTPQVHHCIAQGQEHFPAGRIWRRRDATERREHVDPLTASPKPPRLAVQDLSLASLMGPPACHDLVSCAGDSCCKS
jgi:hypothetical protein